MLTEERFSLITCLTPTERRDDLTYSPINTDRKYPIIHDIYWKKERLQRKFNYRALVLLSLINESPCLQP